MYACPKPSQSNAIANATNKNQITIVGDRAESYQDQRLQQHGQGERIQRKTGRASLATKRPYNALILVVGGRFRSAYKQSSQNPPAAAFLRSSLQTRRDPIRAQNTAFASKLFESDRSERACVIIDFRQKPPQSEKEVFLFFIMDFFCLHTHAADCEDLGGKTGRIPASQLTLGRGADVLAFEARRASSTIVVRHVLALVASQVDGDAFWVKTS